MPHFETLYDLLVEQLQDIYDAEHQLIEAMPRLVVAAKSPELRKVLEDHHKETLAHVSHLTEVFFNLNIKSVRKPCCAMNGLIREANEILNATGNPDVIDAALIAAVQRIEHYEIAAYGCVKAFASEEGFQEVAKILEVTAKEEGASDKLLSKIAEGGMLRKSINKEAAKI